MADISGLTVLSVYVEAFGVNHVEATINGVSEDDLLEHIDAQTAVSYYGENTLLDLIGKEEAMAYFGLVEPAE